MALRDEFPVAIRPACLSDLDVLVAIDNECFPTGIAYPSEEIATLLRSRSVRTVIAERIGTVAGFAALGWLGRPNSLGELITIDVLSQFRQQRIGYRLHGDLENWLRERGGAGIQLHVAVDNVAAIHFYERMGYRSVARVSRYYLQRVDAWRMEKRLR